MAEDLITRLRTFSFSSSSSLSTNNDLITRLRCSLSLTTLSSPNSKPKINPNPKSPPIFSNLLTSLKPPFSGENTRVFPIDTNFTSYTRPVEDPPVPRPVRTPLQEDEDNLGPMNEPSPPELDNDGNPPPA